MALLAVLDEECSLFAGLNVIDGLVVEFLFTGVAVVTAIKFTGVGLEAPILRLTHVIYEIGPKPTYIVSAIQNVTRTRPEPTFNPFLKRSGSPILLQNGHF